MFDFFKALFGGAYYIGKLSNEKSKLKEYMLLKVLIKKIFKLIKILNME